MGLDCVMMALEVLALALVALALVLGLLAPLALVSASNLVAVLGLLARLCAPKAWVSMVCRRCFGCSSLALDSALGLLDLYIGA